MAATSPAPALAADLLSDPLIAAVMARWDRIALPQGWLVAGALAQTLWNRRHGFAPGHGIDDIDIVYFDAADLTEAAEARQAARLAALLADLPVRLDVKNEARVHLWYGAKFGTTIAPYRSCLDAMATFPTTATAIGLRIGPAGPDLAAPFGTADLEAGVIRANKRQIPREVYQAKLARWRPLWPRLTYLSWEES